VPVTFQVVGNLADFGNDVRADVMVRATATPGVKVGDVAVHSNEPETVVTDAAGAFVLELVSLPGVWYRIQTPYANAINTVHLAGYVPDVGDPTTGTAFPALTVINLKDVVSEDPTPGFEAVGLIDSGALAAETAARAAADSAHAADTTDVHGITDTAALVLTTDPRLSDARTPTAHTHALAEVTDAGTAAAADVGDFATAAQGVKADTAVQPARTVTAGTGLTGGGDLSADRTLTVAYGTTATTATVGNDSRVTGAAQKSANLSDLADAATARTNLGLNTAATVGALPIPDPGSFYPTDTITAALQLIGGRHIYGTGSPEGVVTAAVGTYYTDTAGTNGAWRWQKRTGAGNTGWVVTTGDGGWRDITSLLVNAWSGAAGSVLALRTTDTVTIAFENLSGAAATATTAFTLPVGYRPRAGRSSRLLFHTATPAIKRFLAYDSGIVTYNGTVPDASGSNYGLQSYPAASTWPASHPGVAA